MFAQQTNFDKLYKNKEYIKNIYWTSQHDDKADSHPEKVYKKIRNSIWYDTDEIIGKHKSGIMQYLKYHADFKYNMIDYQI